MTALTESTPPLIVLTIEEMQQVSRCKQPARMIRWFRENGFVVKVAIDGYPVVSRRHFEEVMGSRGARGRKVTEPNREALDDHMKARGAGPYCRRPGSKSSPASER